MISHRVVFRGMGMVRTAAVSCFTEQSAKDTACFISKWPAQFRGSNMFGSMWAYPGVHTNQISNTNQCWRYSQYSQAIFVGVSHPAIQSARLFAAGKLPMKRALLHSTSRHPRVQMWWFWGWLAWHWVCHIIQVICITRKNQTALWLWFPIFASLFPISDLGWSWRTLQASKRDCSQAAHPYPGTGSVAPCPHEQCWNCSQIMGRKTILILEAEIHWNSFLDIFGVKWRDSLFSNLVANWVSSSFPSWFSPDFAGLWGTKVYKSGHLVLGVSGCRPCSKECGLATWDRSGPRLRGLGDPRIGSTIGLVSPKSQNTVITFGIHDDTW